mmetsp:Transcript_129076/g.373524  ORF Transcript_129076/g.373524 Transcript_129076/m.373524 type:complete len:239 (+) Transcript_129076:949-1665(+)
MREFSSHVRLARVPPCEPVDRRGRREALLLRARSAARAPRRGGLIACRRWQQHSAGRKAICGYGGGCPLLALGRRILHFHLLCLDGRRSNCHADRRRGRRRGGRRKGFGRLVGEVLDQLLPQGGQGGNPRLQQPAQQSPRLALRLVLVVMPQGAVSPGSQGRLHPAGQHGDVLRRRHGPLLLGQPVVAVHADRAAHGLHQGAGACGHVCQHHASHGEEAHALAALRAVGDEHPIQLSA